LPTTDPRVDAYIAKSAGFARPILEHLRAVVHRGCPAVVETIKWGMPFFEHHGPLAFMSAFKAHCGFGFYRAGSLVANRSDEAMGQFGRIASLDDLPARRVLVGYVKEAAKRNESQPKRGAKAKGSTTKRTAKKAKKELPVPEDLASALAMRKHAKARTTFEAFSPSHRREYIEWITGAKRPETRARRLATTLEWLTEGKSQNWRYERPKTGT